jgi:hypothetical protein
LALPTNSPSPPPVKIFTPLFWVVSKNAFIEICKWKQNMNILQEVDKQRLSIEGMEKVMLTI